MKCFVAVYDERSINQAAKKLYITSQGLSKIIKNLENELGTTLFTRTQKGVLATESASFLYERVNALISQLEDIENGIKQLEMRSNSLRIACARGVLNALSFQIILDFIESHPSLDVVWGEFANDEVKEMIASYKADIGIVVGNTKSVQVIERKIASRNITVLIYEGHPLYDSKEISIANLRDEKIIILNEQFQIFHDFKKRCAEYGFNPLIVGKTVDSHFLFNLCKLKVGIGILIDFSTEHFNLENIKVVQLNENLHWDIYQICNRLSIDFENIILFQKHLDNILSSKI